ncbi:hypothetical protein HYV43_03175 [Candidatus Micrarchaeota archaeon]|nr:hypothetical protein [Candidatus Micrarchaeota archaeon]
MAVSFSSVLEAAGWPHGWPAYAGACLAAVGASAGAAALIGSQAGLDAGACFAVVALAVSVPCFLLPGALSRRQVCRLESQLGSALRLLSVRLAFEPFEPALCGACLQAQRPHPALARLAHDVQCGVPPLSALRRFGASPSVPVRKAAMQLAFCYRHGDASALAALADEFSHLQSAALQRFASRTSFASVWFEALGSLLPLLLSAYVLIGASFLDFTFPPALPFWMLAVGFPLLIGVLLMHVLLDAPEDDA